MADNKCNLELANALGLTIAKHTVNGLNSFKSGHVCEPRWSDDVAGSKNAFDGRLIVIVDLYVAAIGALRLTRGESRPSVFAATPIAKRIESAVILSVLSPFDQIHLHAPIVDLDILDGSRYPAVDTFLLERLLDNGCGLVIFDRKTWSSISTSVTLVPKH